jgi:hypothetical protein
MITCTGVSPPISQSSGLRAIVVLMVDGELGGQLFGRSFIVSRDDKEW